MPPPARTMLNTFGQWSRPAVALTFGVRPNSDETMTSVDHGPPGPEALVVDAAGQGQVLDAEAGVGGVVAEAERREGRAEIAGAGESGRLTRDADVGRQVVARAVLVRHDAAHARELQR